MKNIAQPIRAYRIRVETPPRTAPGSNSSLPFPDKPSIAVLPFANMSGDQEQEYFADGMVEEAIGIPPRLQSSSKSDSFQGVRRGWVRGDESDSARS